MNRIASIHRYPVKSLLGEALANARLTPQGIAGDRAWALRDDERGALTNAKRFAPLMALQARFLAEPDAVCRSPTVEITDPSGERLRSDDPEANAWLSRRLGHPVSLWPLPPTEADAPPPTYFDAFPLLILSTSALDELERRARAAGSESVFDVRRFRPNLLVQSTEPGFVEDAWCGRELRVGTVRLKAEMRCPRCIMTTHGFLDLPPDARVMRALVQHHGGDLGVYATVLEAGEIAVGDAVELL